MTVISSTCSDQIWPAASGRLLVVDDSRLQRRILISALSDSGYDVLEAGSAEEALEVCHAARPRIVISDWMMPGMSGLDLCRRLRGIDDDYIYFIILTSKSDKEDLATALREGADDFLSKPLSAEELRARIAAGERLLKMSGELRQKNRLISTTLEKVRDLNAALDRDLVEARKLQMSLVPRRPVEQGAWRISFALQPSGHIGGDMIGAFPTEPGRIGIYALDVSGHGIASALITARLSSWLSGAEPDGNIALARSDAGPRMMAPDEVCRRLNGRFLGDIGTDHYFTIVIGELDLATGRFVFCQAGHPHPLVQVADGTVSFTGAGGPPIGLLEDAEFTVEEVIMPPGSRLLLYSDGITECPDPGGSMLEEEGLARLMRSRRDIGGEALLAALSWELSALVDDGEIPDDLSAILVEHRA